MKSAENFRRALEAARLTPIISTPLARVLTHKALYIFTETTETAP